MSVSARFYVDGGIDCLTLDVEQDGRTLGVDVREPFKDDALDIACQVLIEQLAGVTKAELILAAGRAGMDAFEFSEMMRPNHKKGGKPTNSRKG